MSLDLVSVKQAIFEGSKRLDEASREIFSLAHDYSEAETEYKVAKARATLEEMEKGTPVTVISSVIYDKPYVVEAYKARNYSREIYKSARDSLKAIQSQLSALQSILRTQEEI